MLKGQNAYAKDEQGTERKRGNLSKKMPKLGGRGLVRSNN
jgi:hypothetical protein